MVMRVWYPTVGAELSEAAAPFSEGVGASNNELYCIIILLIFPYFDRILVYSLVSYSV